MKKIKYFVAFRVRGRGAWCQAQTAGRRPVTYQGPLPCGRPVLPDEIGNLRNLVTLTANGNTLSTLPTTIGGLVALEVLELEFQHWSVYGGDYNSLSCTMNGGHCCRRCRRTLSDLVRRTPLTVLPQEIGLCTSLRRLDLRSNALKCEAFAVQGHPADC